MRGRILMKFKPIWILHIVVIAGTAVLFALQHTELENKYNTALGYAEAGNYEEAYKLMEAIAEYKDAPEKTTDYMLELRYQEGIRLIGENDWDNALSCFEAIRSEKDYRDVEYQRNRCIYEQGKKLAYEGDLTNAERKFLLIPTDFEDVAERKQVISDNKKFKGTWKCEANDLDLKTTVYIDYDNTPKIHAEITDHDALLLDEPVTLNSKNNGQDIEIHGDRFTWDIYGAGKSSYSFVYSKEAYTMMKQPVKEGTTKYEFARIADRNYDKLNAQYTTTDF